jgi:hypothetical protein
MSMDASAQQAVLAFDAFYERVRAHPEFGQRTQLVQEDQLKRFLRARNSNIDAAYAMWEVSTNKHLIN